MQKYFFLADGYILNVKILKSGFSIHFFYHISNRVYLRKIQNNDYINCKRYILCEIDFNTYFMLYYN